MMTKREFFKSNERKAFDIAEAQHERKDSAYNIQWIAAETSLILEEWYDDYRHEHV